MAAAGPDGSCQFSCAQEKRATAYRREVSTSRGAPPGPAVASGPSHAISAGDRLPPAERVNLGVRVRGGAGLPSSPGVTATAVTCALADTQNDAPMSCQGPRYVCRSQFWGRGMVLWRGLAGVADKTGKGRSGWRASSYDVTPSRSDGPRDGRRIVSRPARMRQPIRGSGRPRECASARGGAKAGVGLAGDVTLEAADDLRLGLTFGCAAFDVGAGGRVGAHAGEDDAPQGVVGLAVAARVEPVADGLA